MSIKSIIDIKNYKEQNIYIGEVFFMDGLIRDLNDYDLITLIISLA